MRRLIAAFPSSPPASHPSLCAVLLNLFLFAITPVINRCSADDQARIAELITEGRYAAAEKLLEEQIPDNSAPVTGEAAIQRELLRRMRYDFSLTSADVLKQIQQSIPDATMEDVDRWRDAGALAYRTIDGEPRFFRRAVSNLLRFDEQAKRRKIAESKPATKKFDLDTHLAELVRLRESSENPELYPVHHRLRYVVTVSPDHPRVQAGAVARVWLPFPQEYRQQGSVKLVRSRPPHTMISSHADSPHRSIYFEQTISDSSEPLEFVTEYEFVTSAFCPKLTSEQVEPYDQTGEIYRKYTAERAPHIVFSPEVKRLTVDIVGNATNPLEKVLRIFHWVSQNVPWCAEMEYSIIPNLSAKGLSTRRGDCGVQSLTFITLCRAAGIPARWQSGWQTKPGDWNMHDWSEFYLEPWGWLPADVSYGVREHADPRVRDFLCGGLDPYRLIVNLDYGRALRPEKISYRSEPNDFQRGEVEIDGHNLYFDEWDWEFDVVTKPLEMSLRE